MDFDRLKAFSLVAEFQSLAKPANVLSVSQSWVSKQISNLEKELGYHLFFRNTKKFVLTENGKIFLESSQKILKEFQNTQALIENNKDTISGEVSIATTQAIANLYIAEALSDFMKAHPQVSFSVLAHDTPAPLNLGMVNSAILPYIANQEDFEKKHLCFYQMNLYASKDYIEKFGAPQTPEDLKSHRLIAYNMLYDSPPYAEINWHLQLSSSRLKPFLSINSGAATLHAVESGIGIGPLSQVGVKKSTAKLIRILPDYPGPSIEIFFYYPTVLENSKKIKLLYSSLKKFFDPQ